MLEDDLDYEPPAEMSVQARADAAARRSRSSSTTRCSTPTVRMFVLPFFNYAHGNHDDVYAMLTHPRPCPASAMAAHTSRRSVTPMPTYQLSHWVMGRTRLRLGPRPR
ncbi:MAG: hypothetical protein U0W40_13190 [Acidimicrobiia bacterium]